MSKFKVGDICIVHSLRYDTHFNGCEVTIFEVNNPEHVATHGTLKGMSLAGTYRVDLLDVDGTRMSFLEYNLKLKKFDGEKKVTEMFKNVLTPVTNTEMIEYAN